MALLRRLCAAFLVLVSAAACTSQAPAPDAIDDGIVAAEATIQPRDLVDLTVYLREGRGASAHLTPVIREVPVDADLPRTALALLLAGPAPDDRPSLQAPLPTTTRIRQFSVANGTARVTLSREAVAHADRVGRRSQHEAVALAAVANTLTEFPDIQRVRLRIQGQRGGRFWGAWGLPEMLVRDESLIEPQRRTRTSPPDRFTRRAQRVGVAQQRGRPPAVSAVRVQSQSTYLRVTVEVTSATGDPLKGPIPRARVRRSGKTIVLRVDAAPSTGVVGTLEKQLRDPAFRWGVVDVAAGGSEVVVRLRPRRNPQFWLHTLSRPARVVLDIRR